MKTCKFCKNSREVLRYGRAGHNRGKQVEIKYYVYQCKIGERPLMFKDYCDAWQEDDNEQ